MIFTLVLCGLALEAFRLSVAAGRHSGEFSQKKNDLVGRNLCGSTAFFVFAGNWIPVEMD